jgi:hypothetical protein
MHRHLTVATVLGAIAIGAATPGAADDACRDASKPPDVAAVQPTVHDERLALKRGRPLLNAVLFDAPNTVGGLVFGHRAGEPPGDPAAGHDCGRDRVRAGGMSR